MRIVPNSWGSPRLREFNSCHDDLGRFCATQAVGSQGSQLVLADRPSITTGVSRVAKARRAIKGEMRPVTGAEEKRARKKFAIPPMYTNVMVTDDPNSEVRATAYSPNTGKTVPFHSKGFKKKRESQKWSRVANIAKDIGKVVERVNKDSARVPEAMTLRIILQTGMRNGEENESGTFGASSLRTEHATVDGDTVRLQFPGKGGTMQDHTITDPMLALHIRQRQRTGKETLFDHDAGDTLAYLRKVTKKAYRVHDIRTYVATALAHRALRNEAKPTTKREFSRMRKRVAEVAARVLHDTVNMVINKYIHPQIWKPYMVGA